MSKIPFPQLPIYTAKPARKGRRMFRAPAEAVLLLAIVAMALALLLR